MRIAIEIGSAGLTLTSGTHRWNEDCRREHGGATIVAMFRMIVLFQLGRAARSVDAACFLIVD